jgi:hypothetical protein
MMKKLQTLCVVILCGSLASEVRAGSDPTDAARSPVASRPQGADGANRSGDARVARPAATSRDRGNAAQSRSGIVVPTRGVSSRARGNADALRSAINGPSRSRPRSPGATHSSSASRSNPDPGAQSGLANGSRDSGPRDRAAAANPAMRAGTPIPRYGSGPTAVPAAKPVTTLTSLRGMNRSSIGGPPTAGTIGGAHLHSASIGGPVSGKAVSSAVINGSTLRRPF